MNNSSIKKVSHVSKYIKERLKKELLRINLVWAHSNREQFGRIRRSCRLHGARRCKSASRIKVQMRILF